MRIDRLEISNFRSFEQRTFTFAPQFNVLVGDNGTGKTAILDALAVGAGAVFLGLDGAKAVSIDASDARRVAHQGQDQTWGLEPNFPVSVRCEGELDGERVEWERTLEGLKRHTTYGKAGELRRVAERLQQKVRAGKPATLPVIAYFGTGRLWLQKRDRALHAKPLDTLKPGSRSLGYRDALNPASDHKSFARWFKTMTLIEVQRRAPTPLLGVQAAIVECLRGWDDVFFDFSEDAIVATGPDGRRLPFGLLSDGVRNAIAMVGDIAYRAAMLNPHLGRDAAAKTPGIVLIDELDLHLHPNWQREIVDDLRRTFPLVQFVVTTHSPFIVQSVRAHELINLDDRSRESLPSRSIEDIAEAVMGVDMPQRSRRHEEMMEAAREYFAALEEAEGTRNPERIEVLKRRLDELSAPFSDDVAFTAFLELERRAARLPEDEPDGESRR